MMIKSVFEILMLIAMGLPQLPPPRDQPVKTEPVEPFKVVNNIYFVGPESEHSSFLITTPRGTSLLIPDSIVRYRRSRPTSRSSASR